MANHRILVIDDSRVIRMRVRDMLPQGNFEVIEAQDGVEGMDAIRSQRPNLIMLDFLLPRMSGWEVFQEIQSNPDLQNIPLVLMSGRKEEVTEKITEPFEYFEFIQKPFEQKELIEAIKASMVKARKPRRTPMTSPAATAAAASSGGGDVSAAEFQALQTQVKQLQGEVAQLKGQLGKMLAYIKQKLK
ncbi:MULTISPECIES: response regulator [Cyanophyceae]|uniref:response regulator n=1 Tax=Cyanophyceae TaxID=3028117 RepID=UPI0016896DCC|nr:MULTISPECIES: response regulator [unclassified Phormidium]MBD1917001.1 response regulator [Phormidium sp. FACHB-77]MBD2029852.1 response regulator [Phormidium sp. FACHB-322]MBD2050360.1 response regulator [Leptolyngbya sp. FACHB-60]